MSQDDVTELTVGGVKSLAAIAAHAGKTGRPDIMREIAEWGVTWLRYLVVIDVMTESEVLDMLEDMNNPPEPPITGVEVEALMREIESLPEVAE